MQADYYECSTWLTEKEKKDIDAKEKIRRNALNARKSHVSIGIHLNKNKVSFISSNADEVTNNTEENEVKNSIDVDLNDTHTNQNNNIVNKTIIEQDNSITISNNPSSLTQEHGVGGGITNYKDSLTNHLLLQSHTKAGYLYHLLKSNS